MAGTAAHATGSAIPIEETIPLQEEILGRWKEKIGEDYTGYRNHVCRMVNFCFALRDCSAEERDKIVIAGCFHALGIWGAETFDYLPPSVAVAKEYLTQNNLTTLAATKASPLEQITPCRRRKGSPGNAK